MKLNTALLLLVIGVVGKALAVPTAGGDEHKDRVKDKKLSEEEHFEGDEHNPDYDHEAFLGKEEAKTFDDLTPEESKERLGKIVDKIDKNNDGKVTEEELQAWIKHVSNRYIMDDAERQWKGYENDIKDGKLAWTAYKETTYGSMTDAEMDNQETNYRDMMRRDERRWNKADQDGDGALTFSEYANFLHPEDVDHMKDIVVDETMEDIDKDKDGKISLAEYIGDMWPEDSEGVEPEWVKTEREQFSQHRDKNNDGFMDRDEVKDWIIPSDYDHTESESKHLMSEADEDKDGFLTKDEILHKYDVFVGSQATDYGEALMKHEEL